MIIVPMFVGSNPLSSTRIKRLVLLSGGGFFEFSSEKKWGTEQDDCKIFDSIDMTRLADSIASVPFHVRHNLPSELFTVSFVRVIENRTALIVCILK